jgi:predicted PurR-regulated permease PerM
MLPDARPESVPRPVGSRRPEWAELLRAVFDVRSPPLTGLFALACFYTLYLARSFFLPIVLAVLLSFLLSPLVRGLKRLYIPNALGAGLILFALLGGVGFGIYELAGPAYQWVETAPQNLRQIERKIRDLKKPVQTMSRATEQVAKIAQVAGGSTVQKVIVQPVTLGEQLLARTVGFASAVAVVCILLYFLLALGDRFWGKLAQLVPGAGRWKAGIAMAREIERDISSYLATVTAINLSLGLAVWGVTAWIGLPNPLLWGVLAWALNYIPYLGPLCTMTVLACVGLLTFNDLGQAFAAPGLFFALDMIEAYLVTPTVMGRRFTLNPVMLFIGLTFWGWLWGVAGALLAVPILVVTKIFCDHSERLAPIGQLLGE